MLMKYCLCLRYFGFVIAGALSLQMVNVYIGQCETQPRHLPLRVYCYSFETAPELNCSLSRSELDTMLVEVNEIWKQAGVRWHVESMQNWVVGKADFSELTGEEEKQEVKQRFFTASEKLPNDGQFWKLAIVRNFIVPAGGIYFPKSHTVYFAEHTPRGKTKSFVLAHELGHSLGLSHIDQPDNLMRIGKHPKRALLNSEQIVSVKTVAVKGPADITDMRGLGGEAARSGGLSKEALREKNNTIQKRSMQRNANSNIDPGERRKRIIRRLQTFDRDGDGVVNVEEVKAPWDRAFKRIDINKDNRITQDEIDDFENY